MDIKNEYNKQNKSNSSLQTNIETSHATEQNYIDRNENSNENIYIDRFYKIFSKNWIYNVLLKKWIWEILCKKWVWKLIIQRIWHKSNNWLMNFITKALTGRNNLISNISIDQSNKNNLNNRVELTNKNWASNKSLIYTQGNYTRYLKDKTSYLTSHSVDNESIFLKCCNNKDVSNVGCGLIAIYNIAVLLSNHIDMNSIIYWFEQNKGFVLNGIFGVNPNTIQTFFKNLNITATYFSDANTLESSRTETTGYYIICQWNDASLISHGAHFYAVIDDGTKLNAINGPMGQFNNFSELLSKNNGGGMICAYKIE